MNSMKEKRKMTEWLRNVNMKRMENELCKNDVISKYKYWNMRRAEQYWLNVNEEEVQVARKSWLEEKQEEEEAGSS